jgi:HSP20 family protein
MSSEIEIRKSRYPASIDEFDQWFEDIRHHWLQPFLPGHTLPEWWATQASRLPRLDIIDRDDHYCVKAELPGVDKDHLEVSLEDNRLTIQASSHKDEQTEKERFFRRELFRGQLQRVVHLPTDVEADQVKATFRDGILELTLKKSAGTRRTTISVE